MSVTLLVNNVSYSFPETGDENWGDNVKDWATAISQGALQKAGGSFTLTAEVNFGATYGLKSAYYKSQATNPSSTGIVRLGNNESVAWRDNANSADLSLKVNTSDQLEFGGYQLLDANGSGLTGLITNAMVNAAAAIAYSKLNLSDSILNADINSSAAIAYSKLNLSGSILNADINASAAIALSKLAAVTANRALASDASGFVTASAVTDTELGYVSGVTSSIQTQLNAKALDSDLTTHESDTSTHGVGEIVGTSETQSLSNKTITDALKFKETGGGSNYSAFQAPASLSGDVTFTLPNGDGTIGQALTTNGSGILSWATAGSTKSIVSIDNGDSPYTASSEDIILCDASSGAITINLPAVASNSGKQYTIQKIKSDTSFNVVTIDGNSSETIDGNTTTTLNTFGETIVIICDGTAWSVVDRKIDSTTQSYTPTLAGFGTVTSLAAYWKRVGDCIQLQANWTNGTTVATTASVTLPSGLSFSSSKVNAIAVNGYYTSNSFGATVSTHLLSNTSTNKIEFALIVGSSNGFTSINGNNFSTGAVMSATTYLIPIDGWNG